MLNSDSATTVCLPHFWACGCFVDPAFLLVFLYQDELVSTGSPFELALSDAFDFNDPGGCITDLHPSPHYFLKFCFEVASYQVAQAGLKFGIFLPQLSE